MSKQQTNDQAEMTFGEHLDEVRKILIRVALTFAVLFIVLFAMKGIVLDVVFAPIRETFPTNRLFIWLAELMGTDALRIHPENVDLFNNKMAGQFLLHIKSSVVGAFIIGICENIIKALGYTTFSDAFTFALLIVILVFKPTGLFGEKATDKV